MLHLQVVRSTKLFNAVKSYGTQKNTLINWRKRRKKKNKEVDNLINRIERIIFYFSDKSEILMSPEYIASEKNIMYERIKNFSWCYGFAGYINSIIENSQFEGSIFYENRSNIKNIILSIIKRNFLKQNELFESNIFCHGLPGFLYSLLVADSEFFSVIINQILQDILKKYFIDHREFLDIDAKKSFAVIDGSIGTLLVLMSVIDNKRFIGDFIFNI